MDQFVWFICMIVSLLTLNGNIESNIIVPNFGNNNNTSSNHDQRSFMYTSAVNKNGQTSSFSIFTGSDGKLHYMKETSSGEFDHGELDDNQTLNIPLLDQDALFYFPNEHMSSSKIVSFQHYLQTTINNAVRNYLQNLGIGI